jgi:hypothetical protein
MFKVPEEYRITDHPFLSSDTSYGNQGAFQFPLKKWIRNTMYKGYLFCIASEECGWEHVSVHLELAGKKITPLWDDMCYIKNKFWNQEDCVVQFHPPKSEYVNQHPNTLHLWRNTERETKTPPSILVGLK